MSGFIFLIVIIVIEIDIVIIKYIALNLIFSVLFTKFDLSSIITNISNIFIETLRFRNSS